MGPAEKNRKTDPPLKETVSRGNFPVGNAHLICQELIKMFAVGFYERLSVFIPYCHGCDFVHIKKKQKTGHTEKIDYVPGEKNDH